MQAHQSAQAGVLRHLAHVHVAAQRDGEGWGIQEKEEEEEAEGAFCLTGIQKPPLLCFCLFVWLVGGASSFFPASIFLLAQTPSTSKPQEHLLTVPAFVPPPKRHVSYTPNTTAACCPLADRRPLCRRAASAQRRQRALTRDRLSVPSLTTSESAVHGLALASLCLPACV